MFKWSSNCIIRFALISIASLTFTTAFSQSKWSISGGIGYASYSAPGLHEYQNYIITNSIFPLEKSSEFPMYFTFGVGLNYTIDKAIFAFKYTRGSTGGRLSYSDYSGKVIADQLVSYDGLMMSAGYKLNQSNSFDVYLAGAFTYTFYLLKIRNSIDVASQHADEAADFKSSNLGFQPYLMFRKTWKSIFLSLNIGYELQDSVELRKTDEPGVWLAGNQSSHVSMQGSGFRSSLSFGINLN